MRFSLRALFSPTADRSARKCAQGPGRLEACDRLIRLGNELEDSGKIEAALEQYREAARLTPAEPRPYMNIGNALRRLARHDEALAAQRTAVSHSPEYAPARFNLAIVLGELGDLSGAERELLEALERQPAMVEARVVLADIYEAWQRFDDAETQFKLALDRTPEHAGILLNYAMFCFRQGRLEETYGWLQKAKSADAEMWHVQSFLLMWSNYRDDTDAETIAREHMLTGAALSSAGKPAYGSWRNTVDEDRLLRVGYISGDFMPHPVALFVRPVIEGRNMREFQTLCYSNYGRKNEIADRLKQSADQWREIAPLDDEQVVDLIREDQIDVLVDLSGHTDRNRLSVFARHPAPVQVAWLGYLNTTGLPAMDYRICDWHTDPPGATEHLHTEQLVRMPHSQWCYAPWYGIDFVPAPHVGSPDDVVFGSFNQLIKITATTLSLWSRILKKVERAKLVVFDVRQPATAADLLRRMTQHGIDTTRVTLRGRESLRKYFAAIGNVDIALDTTPYNGATTTLDTLWMGVPIVALRGERAISRGSYSILRTLEADELIALNEEDYVEMNVCLAQDHRRRALLRKSLRERLAASPLMDAQGFTRALEERYREMWRTWCRKIRLASP